MNNKHFTKPNELTKQNEEIAINTINNLLLTEREGHSGECWPEVVTVRVHKTTEGQYSPVRLEQARLVTSLLYGTLAMLVLNLPKTKKHSL